jgi:hypothetical protein
MTNFLLCVLVLLSNSKFFVLVLRVGLAFQPQILLKMKLWFAKIFFERKSDEKQHVCSKLVKNHTIVQFEKPCRSNSFSKSILSSRCCGFFGSIGSNIAPDILPCHQTLRQLRQGRASTAKRTADTTQTVRYREIQQVSPPSPVTVSGPDLRLGTNDTTPDRVFLE